MSSVLVVDDEAPMLRLMMRWVELTGHQAAAAASAEEALDVLAEQRPAVAVCDVRMPGHDGIWLADRIRQQFSGTAELYSYFASTAVILILVSVMPPNRPDHWLSGARHPDPG